MRAITWQGRGDVRLTEVPDPRIEDPGDLIVKVTSTAICGSDLHLYGPLTAFMTPGDVMGHEFMGTVEAVGSGITRVHVGDRVVVPFNISCGRCYMCERGLQSQCCTGTAVPRRSSTGLRTRTTARCCPRRPRWVKPGVEDGARAGTP